VFVIIGSAILIARRERISVTEEATVMLECPYCKHARAKMSKVRKIHPPKNNINKRVKF
jgi:hypothetical protein